MKHEKSPPFPPPASAAAAAVNSEQKLLEVNPNPHLPALSTTGKSDVKPQLCMPSASHACMSVEANCSKSACAPEVRLVSVGSSELNGVPLSKSRVGSVEGIQPDSGKEENVDSNPSVQQEEGEEEEEGEGEEGGTEGRRKLDDSLDADFKQSKKRFRTPGATGPVCLGTDKLEFTQL